MTAHTPEPNSYVIEDEDLEALLDAVDERTKIQQMLHNHIGDGFMSLARERYREPSSAERLGRLVYDDRDDVRSNIHVCVTKGDQDVITMARQLEEDFSGTADEAVSLRRRKRKEDASTSTKEEGRVTRHVDVRNSIMPVPSREVREAIRSFRLVVDQAIELANINSKLQAAIHARTDT